MDKLKVMHFGEKDSRAVSLYWYNKEWRLVLKKVCQERPRGSTPCGNWLKLFLTLVINSYGHFVPDWEVGSRACKNAVVKRKGLHRGHQSTVLPGVFNTFQKQNKTNQPQRIASMISVRTYFFGVN